jgi:hypothetical protein
VKSDDRKASIIKNWRNIYEPVLRDINSGGLFIPPIQSLAAKAGVVPAVSGYKSSWNWSLLKIKKKKKKQER